MVTHPKLSSSLCSQLAALSLPLWAAAALWRPGGAAATADVRCCTGRVCRAFQGKHGRHWRIDLMGLLVIIK